MSEDLVLNGLVRAALEEGGAFDFRQPQRRPRLLPWAVSSLLAASLTVVAAMRAWVAPPRSDVLAGAIAFLSEADGVEIEAGDPAEMLLDWQEAPLWL